MTIYKTLLQILGLAKTETKTITLQKTLDNILSTGAIPAFKYAHKNNVSDKIGYSKKGHYQVITVNNISYYFDVNQKRYVVRCTMLRNVNGKALRRTFGTMQNANKHVAHSPNKYPSGVVKTVVNARVFNRSIKATKIAI